jgi:hypothetical protein
MDYENIWRIEKEAAAQDHFDNISDTDQDTAARKPSLILKVNNIEFIELKLVFSLLIFFV